VGLGSLDCLVVSEDGLSDCYGKILELISTNAGSEYFLRSNFE
jgi:hypothetical protein